MTAQDVTGRGPSRWEAVGSISDPRSETASPRLQHAERTHKTPSHTTGWATLTGPCKAIEDNQLALAEERTGIDKALERANQLAKEA